MASIGLDPDILFQSSPGPKAGCYTGNRHVGGGVVGFQSSPGPKAGCYEFQRFDLRYPFAPFQSSPGPRAGCYGCIAAPGRGHLRVSILTRP